MLVSVKSAANRPKYCYIVQLSRLDKLAIAYVLFGQLKYATFYIKMAMKGTLFLVSVIRPLLTI
jgi:hypothetical protein